MGWKEGLEVFLIFNSPSSGGKKLLPNGIREDKTSTKDFPLCLPGPVNWRIQQWAPVISEIGQKEILII